MAEKDLIGKLVKLKSGKVGMVVEAQEMENSVFLTILISGHGMINMRADDVVIL